MLHRVAVLLMVVGGLVASGQDAEQLESEFYSWKEPDVRSQPLNTGFSATPISTKSDLSTESEGSPEFRPSTEPAPQEALQPEAEPAAEPEPSAQPEPSAEPEPTADSATYSDTVISTEPDEELAAEAAYSDEELAAEAAYSDEELSAEAALLFAVGDSDEGSEPMIEYVDELTTEQASESGVELFAGLETDPAEETNVGYTIDDSFSESEAASEPEPEPAAEPEPEPSAELPPRLEPEQESPALEEEEEDAEVVEAVAAAPAGDGCPVGTSDLTCRHAADNATLCSGRGGCDCGRCRCHQPHVSGEFCQCDNSACPVAGPMALPCGGNGYGVCRCGACECLDGRSGPACQQMVCPPRDTPHRCRPEGASPDEPECSGRGRCVCGECLCAAHGFEKYTGDFCHICPTCPAQCSDYSGCVQQRLFSSGVAAPLSRFCQSLKLEVVEELGHVPEGEQVCTAPLDDGRCRFQFTLRHDIAAMTVYLRAKQEKICIAEEPKMPPHHQGMHEEEMGGGPGAVDEALLYGLKDKLANIDFNLDFTDDLNVPELEEVSNDLADLEQEDPRDSASTDPRGGSSAVAASLAMVIAALFNRVLY